MRIGGEEFFDAGEAVVDGGHDKARRGEAADRIFQRPVEGEEGGQVGDALEARDANRAAKPAEVAGYGARRPGSREHGEQVRKPGSKGCAACKGRDQDQLLVLRTEAQEVQVAHRLLAGIRAEPDHIA